MTAVAVVIISFLIALLGLIREGRASSDQKSVLGLRPLVFVMILLSAVGMTFGIAKEMESIADAKNAQQQRTETVDRLKGIEALLRMSASSPRLELSHEQTRQAQEFLHAAGLYDGPMTGEGNPKLDAAIREFQERLGMKPDGIVGPATQSYMKRMIDLLKVIYSESSDNKMQATQ